MAVTLYAGKQSPYSGGLERDWTDKEEKEIRETRGSGARVRVSQGSQRPRDQGKVQGVAFCRSPEGTARGTGEKAAQTGRCGRGH